MEKIINKILKYILIGMITGLSVKYIPKTALQRKEILMICFTVSVFYAVLDRILPSINFIRNNNSETD